MLRDVTLGKGLVAMTSASFGESYTQTATGRVVKTMDEPEG